jgi:hypothetical protein
MEYDLILQPDELAEKVFNRVRECANIGTTAPAVEKWVGIAMPVFPEAEKGVEFCYQWSLRNEGRSIGLQILVRTSEEATVSFDFGKLAKIFAPIVQQTIHIVPGYIEIIGVFENNLIHLTIVAENRYHD